MRNFVHIIFLLFVLLIVGCTDEGQSSEETSGCVPSCDGKMCGPDGCGGACGVCGAPTICNEGICIAQPACQGSSCVQTCPVACGSNQVCSNGRCVDLNSCVPDCTGKFCGDNGCGGLCGVCGNELMCADGKCIEGTCTPSCSGRECGSDGCGGLCGVCQGATCDESSGSCIPWRVSGKIVIETRQVYYNEYKLPRLEGSLDIPGSWISLTLYDSAGNQIGATVTDEDGSFTISINRPPEPTDWLLLVPAWYVNDELKLAVLVASTNSPYDMWAWTIYLSNFGKANDFGDLGNVRVTEDQSSGGLFLYTQLVNAYKGMVKYGFATDLAKLPSMGVIWKPGVTWTCGTCFVNSMSCEVGKEKLKTSMFIGGDTQDESAWGLPTILHEFGHYVLARFKDSSEGGMHTMSTVCGPTLAWSEGFATFYSLMSRSLEENRPVSQYWRVLKAGSYWLDFAHLFETEGFGSIVVPKPKISDAQGMRQNLGEAWVTYMLWDFWDGAEIEDPTVPPDGVRLGTVPMSNALFTKRYTNFSSYNTHSRTAYGVDFVDYVDALLCQASNSEFTAITDLLIERDFPYDLKPECP